MTVQKISLAFDRLGIPPYLQLSLLEPLADEVSTVLFEGLGVPEAKVVKHVRTGGNESPACWNAVVAAMWADIVQDWDKGGLGYE
eukprot:5774496-Pyramimonas_sp.AAC.1